MKIKRKAKSGMTLIEIIISVALIAILFIPIANIAFTSMKTNSKAEKKQVASAEGQRLLEEFSTIDNLNFTRNASGIQPYVLSDGNTQLETFTQDGEGINRIEGSATCTLDGTDFEVQIDMVKDDRVSHNLTTENQYEDGNYACVVKLKNNNYIGIFQGGVQIGEDISIAGCTSMKIYFRSNSIIVQKFSVGGVNPITETITLTANLEEGQADTNLIKIGVEDAFNLNPALPIDISSDVNVKLDVVNITGHDVKIIPNHNYEYIDYENGGGSSLTNGNVIIGYNLTEETMEEIGDVYTISITLNEANTNNTLFSGSITKNIVINT